MRTAWSTGATWLVACPLALIREESVPAAIADSERAAHAQEARFSAEANVFLPPTADASLATESTKRKFPYAQS